MHDRTSRRSFARDAEEVRVSAEHGQPVGPVVEAEHDKAQSPAEGEALLPTRLDPAALARTPLQGASFNARR